MQAIRKQSHAKSFAQAVKPDRSFGRSPDAAKKPATELVKEPAGMVSYLALLGKLRQAEDAKALHHVITNNTRPVLQFRQAFLLQPRAGRWKVSCVSSLPAFDSNAPMIRHIEQIVSRAHGLEKRCVFDIGDLAAAGDSDAAASPFRHALFIPILDRSGECVAGLLCAREKPWRDDDAPLVDEVGAAISHAWSALEEPKKKSALVPSNKRKLALAGLILVSLALCLPVSMTALAPAEIVAAEPAIIAAPLDGVIGTLPVAPNTPVKKGDVILRFVNTKLNNDAAIAERKHAVAQARLRRIVQVTFDSQKDARDLAIAQAELDVAKAELERAQALNARSVVRAPMSGLLVYSAKADWLGKPVATGERIMDIVDPAKTELRIDLAVSDAITLRPKANVTFFPDGDPLDSSSGVVLRPGYRASVTADNKLAYRSFAKLTDKSAKHYRIGARGIAKLYGERAPLGLYLFRRPVSAIRQQVGL